MNKLLDLNCFDFGDWGLSTGSSPKLPLYFIRGYINFEIKHILRMFLCSFTSIIDSNKVQCLLTFSQNNDKKNPKLDK